MTSARKSRIAIIGAGPAGASAGWHLATRGHAVTLIDRAAFPRDKTCGDWLTPAALSELAQIGLDDTLLGELAPGHAIITATRLVAPNGRASTRKSGAPGACIPRRMLDNLVREHAIAAGCAPVQRTIRALAADAEYLSAFDLVVDARGATVGHANAIGMRTYFIVPRSAVDPAAAHRVEIRTAAAFRRGYGWVFPVHADDAEVRFNVGVGLWKDDSGAGHSVADYLDRFIAHDPVVHSIAAAATESSRPVGYPVALGQWRARVAEDRVLRIGDAANLADPLTGDGIGNALASGRLAAEAVDGAKDARDAVHRWQHRFDEVIAPELRRALLLSRMLTPTSAKNLATQLLDGVARGLGTRLHRAVFGESRYGDSWHMRD